MSQPESKVKGDQGVGFVMAAFMAQRVPVALPVSEHLPFDLVAISPDLSLLLRVSVKYRAVVKGSIELRLRSVWSNRKGVHYNYLDRGDVDAHAIYCPDSGQCYFIRDDEITTRSSFKLRVSPAKIKDKRGRDAADYISPLRLFD